jgi:hypothetical protein
MKTIRFQVIRVLIALSTLAALALAVEAGRRWV